MLAYVLIKDVMPWGMNRYFPERMKAEQAKRSADALLLKNELEEKEHRRKMEERTAEALEGIKQAVVISNERIDELTRIATEHNTFTINAVTTMREVVAKSKRDSQPKIRVARKIKP